MKIQKQLQTLRSQLITLNSRCDDKKVPFSFANVARRRHLKDRLIPETQQELKIAKACYQKKCKN